MRNNVSSRTRGVRVHSAAAVAALLAVLIAWPSIAGAAAVRGPVVSTATTRLGRVLVTSSGRTLYLFEKDRNGKSACAGKCAQFWPPLIAVGKPVAGAGTKASLLGTTKRADGRRQVTYNHHPLYTFVKDAKAGQTSGEGIDAFGAEWYAVSAAGTAVVKAKTGGYSTTKSSAVIGHVYVNDNTAGSNTVAGFDRHADGSVTPIPGSPFRTGGSGAGHADASQGSLQLSADGRYLLAVDAGSDAISVLRIKHDGSLDVADVVSSNGGNPVSIAVSGRLVYVANADANNPNYTGFTLNPGGRLQAIPGSTVVLPAGSQPGDILFSPDGAKLVGTRVATSLIDSFTLGGDGLLTAAPGSPFEHQAGVYGQFGSEFNPTDPTQLFVSNAHTADNGPAPGSVSAYTDATDGTLSPMGASPFANDGVASCWVEISHDGRYLFAVNTASATVASYSIGAGGTLTAVANTPITSGKGAEDARLSPDGSTLWAVNPVADTIDEFAVDGGVLTELASTTGAANATPSGIVVT